VLALGLSCMEVEALPQFPALPIPGAENMKMPEMKMPEMPGADAMKSMPGADQLKPPGGLSMPKMG